MVYQDTAAQLRPNRVFKFDNLKFFLILCVVIGHFADDYTASHGIMKSVYVFIYTFHMPLFIFMAGLFQKRFSNSRPLNGHKIFAYILIGFMLKISFYIIDRLFGSKPQFQVLSDNYIPWFMFALAAFLIITYIVRNIPPVFVLLYSLVIACLAGYDQSVGDYLYLSRIFVFYPFYYIGYCLDVRTVMDFLNKKSLKILSAVLLTLYLLVCFFRLDFIYLFRALFTGRNAYVNVFEGCNLLHRLFCYGLSGLIGISLICLTPDRPIPLITNSGSRTLQIFFWHGLVLEVIRNTRIAAALQLWLPHAWMLLYLLLGTAITLLLTLPWFGYPLKLLMKRPAFTAWHQIQKSSTPA